MDPLISLLVGLLVFAIVGGLVYWLVTLLPLPQPFKNIAIVAVVLILIVVLLVWISRTGIFGGALG